MEQIIELFKNKNGLEVGGLSRMFNEGAAIPLYPVINDLDGCNFSSKTLWEGGLKEGRNYNFFKNKFGYQYICEATEISHRMPVNKYDFIISSNCLEHIANPLKAISQFLSVLKIGGILLLALPKKEVTFDHKRAVTLYDHLYEDFEKDVKEDDLSHLEEILIYHDLALDPPAGNIHQFKERSLKNFENRGLHQHIFDDKLLLQIFNSFNMDTLFQKDIGSDYIIVGGRDV